MPRRALILREGKAPVRDRLLTMLFLAGLLHGLLIVGLTFNAAAGEGSAPGLEVLLVSDELPEADQNPAATYLAQRTQLGSGNSRTPVATHNPSSHPVLQHAGTPRGDSLADFGDQSGKDGERVLTTTAWNTDVRYLAEAGTSGTRLERPLLLDDPPALQPGPEDESGAAALRGPQREELWITPDTRAATLAPYLDAWRRKVERIGTLNYPTAARVGGAIRNPVVEVGILANGQLDRAVIRRSSGSPELDQAALAILRLSSPFDPFAPELAAEYRVLRFAYEWQFTGGRGTVSAIP
jgi:periplasmic protein TonB